MKNTEQYKILLQAVPHVAVKMELFWGSEYFSEYINHLILDTRDGSRQGFSEEVSKAIFELHKSHNELFPQMKKESIWDKHYRW